MPGIPVLLATEYLNTLFHHGANIAVLTIQLVGKKIK